MAAVSEPLPVTGFRPRLSRRGLVARTAAATALAGVVLALPLLIGDTWNQRLALGAIYAVIGLSVNVLTGHAGQLSLGHQAFVGVGAFMSVYMVSSLKASFVIGMVAAAAIGVAMAVVLGLVALRVRGLYLAVATFAFGLTVEATVFSWEGFTGGAAGVEAARPGALSSNGSYAYLCLGVLAAALMLDWRLVKTKAGRAMVALRNNEQVAAMLGVNVPGYKLLAFGISGLLAGLAGALFAHWDTVVRARDFTFPVAVLWVLMAVIGGLGSRAGVVISSAFFGIFPLLLPATTVPLPFFGDTMAQLMAPLLAAPLLLLTLTLYPGGIGKQLLPVRRWLAGGPLRQAGARRVSVHERAVR